MAAHGIDVLRAQANNDFVGGDAKYLSDLPATMVMSLRWRSGATSR